MFHGCGKENVASIFSEGFDTRRQRRNLYGCGVYHALNAQYSADNHFSPPDTKGDKTIIISAILHGDISFENEKTSMRWQNLNDVDDRKCLGRLEQVLVRSHTPWPREGDVECI